MKTFLSTLFVIFLGMVSVSAAADASVDVSIGIPQHNDKRVIVCAEDFHLVQTISYGDTLAPSGKPATNSIYVLLLPIHNGSHVVINPVVLKKFDAKEIGQIISGALTRGFLPSGSVLHFDPSPEMERPPEAEIQALTNYCKKAGITLIVSETA